MPHIHLDRVSMFFRINQGSQLSLKDWFLQGFRRKHDHRIEVRALEDVSLEVQEGARLGVVGHNGAGKSTLLKLLAGIYTPTRGVCEVKGRVCSLFDIGLGFEPEATGWENIKYRGFLQGETPRSIKAKIREIAEFTELGDKLDLPIRYYSAGMMVRLAFSIATSIEPEVLLLDEVLAAGDLAFQEKAKRRIKELIDRARLMVFVSHDLYSLEQWCDRILWLDHGRVRQVGPVRETLSAYQTFMQELANRAA
jgi:ABC-type polysaccharide/polyol phosphate transport system ATPase subunit